MSTGSKPQTTTTTNEPPAYLARYLDAGAQNAYGLYASPGGGAPITPFSPQTETALQMAENRAVGGSPVTRAAQNYATTGLSGGFMGSNPFLQGGSNPYLDQTFNRAAGAVTNQVQSNFSLAGRNPRGPDAAGLAGEQYNDLAAQIYGGAYESDANRRLSSYQNERALQQSLVPFAGQLASQDYADIGQLANVGAQRESLQREYDNQAGTALDQYLARISGLPGSTVTQNTPTQRNVLGGALGGASAGSMFGPWGILGGGLLGAIYG